MSKKYKIGELAKLKKVTWASEDGMCCLVDDTGPIISIKGETANHNNVHKYAIRMTNAIVYTNNPLKP